MMRSRRRRSLAGIAALAAMLFAQAAFALAVCDPGRMSSRAQMLVAQSEEHAPCHEPAENNVNLCLTHCQNGEQTLDKHQVKVPALAFVAVLTVRPRSDVRQPMARATRTPLPAAEPPPRILYRTLLI